MSGCDAGTYFFLLFLYFLQIDYNDKQYFKNYVVASKWYEEHHLKKLRKAVDRTEWFMTPPTVNAYYEPSENEIGTRSLFVSL